MGFNNQWPELNKFSMLLVSNNRSKAYLQNLIINSHVPSYVILLDPGSIVLPEHTENDQVQMASKQKLIQNCHEADISFDEKEHVRVTLEKNNIPFEIIPSLDVNSDKVVNAIKACPGKYVVYSGPGGIILRSEILSTGKYFLHVHPGWLPDYRGSTTIYYSILAGDAVGCSVIAFTEAIDQGPVFYRKIFSPSPYTNFDYVFDPAIRTSTLVDFFNIFRNKIPVSLSEKNEGDVKSELFFIIHPVLKHLSLLSLSNKKFSQK
jgi:methionyl-tRNA formyltransferase